ncbi:MAG TPA: NTPase [Pyrodictium delaneyi]|uniref:Nucleoside-triphosphatase EYH50_02775 n=1 Tax=Pyrodictium delaneyi TaxID=1273541 RepID=A0A833E9A0_9CREN|nr:NTPase [Pyrodictium delaneyi]
MEMYALVTGRPGVGKTTLVRRVIEKLRKEGYELTGFFCPEVRQNGRRIGFKITSLDGSLEAWLARIEGCNGPRVGRYNTCQEAEEVARGTIERIDNADLIVIDEIGPMELRLRGIREIILRVLRSGKPGLFVVHERLSDREILPILQRRGRWYRVTVENRDSLVNDVYNFVKSLVKRY